jgi:NAD(P)-dependent dehydrogenase (short-subunit alcohol dehydrogenase family)
VDAKAGVRGFAGLLRKELNPQGIGVHLIKPGSCDADMGPFVENQEMLGAEQVAEVVYFVRTMPEGAGVVSLPDQAGAPTHLATFQRVAEARFLHGLPPST